MVDDIDEQVEKKFFQECLLLLQIMLFEQKFI
jgi:hypothetical protein